MVLRNQFPVAGRPARTQPRGRGRGRALALACVLLLGLGAAEATAQLRGQGLPNLGPPALPGAGPGLPGAGPGLPGAGPALPGPNRPDPLPTLRPPAADALATGRRAAEPLTEQAKRPADSLSTLAGQAARPVKPLGPREPGPARRSGMPPAGEQRFVGDEVVLALPAGLSPQALDALARRHRLTRLESQRLGLTGTTLTRWRIADRRSVREVIRALEADASVRGVQPNYRYALQQGAAPQGDPQQYTLAKLRLPQAHGLAMGDKVRVAVIDSGIDTAHPELRGMVVDAFDALKSAEPPHAHGTAIAGAIVAHARLMGAAPKARLLAVRAFGSAEHGAESTTLDILRSLDWAAARGARVINMSFAGPYDPAISRSLAALHQKGIVLIAAAGNAGPQAAPLYPAADPNVIAVAATDAEDRLFGASSRGRHVALAAPGVDILLPAPGGAYQLSSGTSFAAAHVSGIAALLLERRPDLKPDALRKILLASAKDLGPKGRDDQFGAGLADAYQAVLSLAPPPPRVPTAAAAPVAAR